MACPNCGFESDPDTGDVYDVTFPCPRCGHGGAQVYPPRPPTLEERVAGRHAIASGFFEVGDLVWMGKYKNKLGRVIRLFMDEKGHPAVEVEPIPKGRKSNKIFGLFKMWKVTPEQAQQLKEQGKVASHTQTQVEPGSNQWAEEDTVENRVVRRFLAAKPRKSLEQIVGKVLSGMVEHAVDAKPPVTFLTKVTLAGKDTLSDGTLPAHMDPDSLGYSFTLTYPAKAEVSGVYVLRLPDIVKTVRYQAEGMSEEEEDTVNAATPEDIEKAVKAVDVGDLLKKAVQMEGFPDKGYEMANEFLSKIEDAAYQEIDEDVSAYSNEEENVDLPEYPNVEVRLKLQRAKVDLGSPKQQGEDWQLPMKVTWSINIAKWSLGRGWG